MKGAIQSLCLFLVWAGLAAGLHAGTTEATEEGRARFTTIDIFVDPGTTPLAAYQVEFSAPGSSIVGIEGGQAPAFREPPAYDRAAMQRDRVIIAAFAIASTNLPAGKAHVATIHLRTTAAAPLSGEVNLHAAGDAQARRVAARATFEERKPHENAK